MLTGERGGGGSVPVQPGGRPPAAGELALVQAFINSHYDLEVDHGAELLATPAGLSRWLSDHGLAPARMPLHAADLTRALAVREGLRELARHNNGRPTPAAAPALSLEGLNQAAAGAGVEIRLGIQGPRFVSAGHGLDRALGVLLAITATTMLDGTWRRLKVCPGHHCGWAFYDHSRNQTGRWCSMSVCGGRSKARAHYRRRRVEKLG
ncbi:MAG: CGNR zinc finger domain-containing protein [Solirubrobacteraceae bacterium]